jgi:hypothetical protein
MKPAHPAGLCCALLLVARVAAGSAEPTPFEGIIAPGTAPKKLADGFTFTERPTRLKGKLYFSDMWFKNPAGGNWTGSPEHSGVIVTTVIFMCLRRACSPTAPSEVGQ